MNSGEMILWSLICEKICFLKFKDKCVHAQIHSLKSCDFNSFFFPTFILVYLFKYGLLKLLCQYLSGGLTEMV